MADNVSIPVVSSKDVATDDVAGVHYQRVKLVDSTADSTTATGVADNPLSVAQTGAVAPTTIELTGPSNGTWGTDIDCRGAQWIVLRVESADGDPGVVAYGTDRAGGTYDQPLEWAIIDADNGTFLSADFHPGTAQRFAYLMTPPPFLQVIALDGGTADPVVASVDLYPWPGPFTRSLDTSGQWYNIVSGNLEVGSSTYAEQYVGGRLFVAPSTRPTTLLDAVTSTGAAAGKNFDNAFSSHALQVTLTGAPATAIVALQGSLDGTTWTTLGTWDKASQTSGDTIFISGKPVTQVRANLTTLSGGTSPTVTAVWAGMAGGGAPLATQPVSGTIAATQSGTWNVGTVTSVTNVVHVDDNSGSLTVDGTVAVSGTTAVSAAALPLPAGASTAAKQPALGTAGTASADVLSVQGIASMTALKVDGSAVTQPVSAAALPLPSGAATAAKQPALGTAGSASTDVLTVQGVASMVALLMQGSAATDAAVSGNPLLAGGRASTAKPSAMSADGDAVPLWLDRSGATVATPPFGLSSTLANVSGSASSVTLLASNTARRSAVIVNDSAATLYVKEGATASTTSYTYKLQTDDHLFLDGAYSGVIDGIWSSATGAARITERA